MTSALISANALQTLLSANKDVRVLDASYGQQPFHFGIGNTVDFDIDAIADTSAPKPHTLPSARVFEEAARNLGLSNQHTIVVYDRAGMAMAASRAWWMFRYFGHTNVYILNGGLPAWANAGLPLQEKQLPQDMGAFTAKARSELLVFKSDILQNINTADFTVLDARDARRYSGDIAEPRAGLESGHIPHSISVPFMNLLEPETGLMKSTAALAAVFEQKKISARDKLVCSCGSGVTACVIALALHEIGYPDAALYDGSWLEWASDASTPKTKGAQP